MKKTNVKHQYNLVEMDFPVDNYNYYVQLLTSVDGGKNYSYIECSHYLQDKTEEEAKQYINENTI